MDKTVFTLILAIAALALFTGCIEEETSVSYQTPLYAPSSSPTASQPPASDLNQVNGEETHPLYAYLKSQQPGILGTEAIKWNFTKFLVDTEGNVVKRFGSSTKPTEIEKDIETLLR